MEPVSLGGVYYFAGGYSCNDSVDLCCYIRILCKIEPVNSQEDLHNRVILTSSVLTSQAVCLV